MWQLFLCFAWHAVSKERLISLFLMTNQLNESTHQSTHIPHYSQYRPVHKTSPLTLHVRSQCPDNSYAHLLAQIFSRLFCVNYLSPHRKHYLKYGLVNYQVSSVPDLDPINPHLIKWKHFHLINCFHIQYITTW